MNVELTGSDALYTVEQLLYMLLPSAEGLCACRVTRGGGMVFARCLIRTPAGKTSGVSRHRLSGDCLLYTSRCV